MPVLPKHHTPLRLATAHVLLSPDHSGKLYGAEDIAYAINDAVDVTNNPSVSTKVDATALIRAFANNNADDFVLPYDGFFGHTGDQHVLYVRRGTRGGRHDGGSKYSLLFGRFSSMEAGRGAHVVQWPRVTMEEHVYEGLVCYLSRSKKRSAAAISPPARQPLVVVHPPSQNKAVVMNYTLDGRAGKYVIPPTAQVIVVRKLREALLPISKEKENTEAASRTGLVANKYGPVSYWAPSGVTGVPNSQLAHLKTRAKVSDEWLKLFGGQRCKFSDRFLRTLTQFGLHNMRGSDEAATMLIAGVIKGLAEELNLPLSSSALSHGVPSQRTLARGEKRLAADVYLSVVEDIKRDNPQYIGLMVDHGKRSGIEHFVKIIMWAGRDKDGNRVIKFFCLDVDRSSHSSRSL